MSFVGLMHQLEVWVFILSFYHSLIYLRAVKVSIEDEDHRHFIWMEDGLLTLPRAEETPQPCRIWDAILGSTGNQFVGESWRPSCTLLWAVFVTKLILHTMECHEHRWARGNHQPKVHHEGWMLGGQANTYFIGLQFYS